MDTTSMLNQQRQEAAEQILRDACEKGLNARKTMAEVKGNASQRIGPMYRRHVQGELAEEPHAYGDDPLAYPTVQWCAFGWFGIWWPLSTKSQDIIDQQDTIHTSNITHQALYGDGI